MEEDGCLINLEDLACTSYPCLAEGEIFRFSTIHPRVAPLILMQINYTIDLDGFVILSK